MGGSIWPIYRKVEAVHMSFCGARVLADGFRDVSGNDCQREGATTEGEPMSKRRMKRTSQPTASLQSPTLNLSLPTVAGCTGYTIYGIAPIPVRVGLGERVRVEPTSDGYNLYEVK